VDCGWLHNTCSNILSAHFFISKDVPGQACSAETPGAATERRNSADLHEEDEEAGTAVQGAAATKRSVGQTGAVRHTRGVQE